MPSTSIVGRLSELDGYKELAKLIHDDDFAARFLTPNIKFNLGVTFILPSPEVAKEMCSDTEKFAAIFPTLVLPYCFKSKKDFDEYLILRKSTSKDSKTIDIPVLSAGRTKGLQVSVNGSKCMVNGVEMSFYDSFSKVKSFDDESLERSISILKPVGTYRVAKADLKPVEMLNTFGAKSKVVVAANERASKELKNRFLYACNVHKEFLETKSWQAYINAVCHIASMFPAEVASVIDPNPFIAFHLIVEPLKPTGPYVINDIDKVLDVPCIENHSGEQYKKLFEDSDACEKKRSEARENMETGNTAIDSIIEVYSDDKKLWQDEFRFCMRQTLARSALVDMVDLSSIWNVLNMYKGEDCKKELCLVKKDTAMMKAVSDFVESPDFLYCPCLNDYGNEVDKLSKFTSNELLPKYAKAFEQYNKNHGRS
jgi:hypothetical protein